MKKIIVSIFLIGMLVLGVYIGSVGYNVSRYYDEVKMMELQKSENYVIEDLNHYGIFESYTRKTYIGPNDFEIGVKTFVLANEMVFKN